VDFASIMLGKLVFLSIEHYARKNSVTNMIVTEHEFTYFPRMTVSKTARTVLLNMYACITHCHLSFCSSHSVSM